MDRRKARLERYRSALRLGLFGLLLLSPLPFGSVEPWAVLGVELWAAVLGALALRLLIEERSALPAPGRWFLLPVGTILAVGLLQMTPVPAGWVRLVAAPTAAARERVASLLPETSWSLAPHTLDPVATSDALLRLTAYLMIGLAAAVAIRDGRHLRQATVVVVFSGAFQGLYGSAEYLSGHQHIFGYAKRYFTENATGTFINRNHYGGYLAMTLPLALGVVLDAARRSGRLRSWRERLLRLAETRGLLLVGSSVAAALIWGGVVLSYSRSGLAVALAGVGFLFLAGPGARKRGVALLLGVVLALPTMFLLWQEVRPPGDRFVADGAELASLSGRLPVWGATLRMVPDYPALGAGLGSFEAVFPLYRPAIVDRSWGHAHNDWLQSLAEGGPLVTLAFLALLVLALTRALTGRVPWEPRSVLPACLGAAVFTVALHSVTDFSLKIPATAVLLSALIGMLAGGSVRSLPRGADSRPPVS